MLPEIQTIVYATDLSERAPRVFRYAMGLAQRYDARIIIVHAIEPLGQFAQSLVNMMVSPETTRELHLQGRARIIEQIRERLENFCSDELCGDPQGRDRVSGIRIEEGRPADVVCELAREVGAELIVVGSHGHTGVGEILLGSVAHRVVQHATVPVLVVRDTL